MSYLYRNAQTSPFFKKVKALKLKDKEARENCLLIGKPLQETPLKIFCDYFSLCFESHAFKTR